MKDAKTYEKKIRKLLTGMKKVKVPEGANTITLIVTTALEESATDAQAAKAWAMLTKEFVDVNELRVAQPSEIAEHLDAKYPFARQTAEQLIDTLNAVFYHANDLSAEFMEDMGKRELRKWLDKKGFSPYVAARVMLHFNGHAVPVDQDLRDTLEMDGLIPADTSLADLQGFLERIIPQKDAFIAHQAFRQYVAKQASKLAKKRKAAAEAERKAAAEAEKKAAAEAKAAAERAAAEAEAAAQAQGEGKPTAKKAAKKAGKKAPKKAAKKVTSKKATKTDGAKKTPKKASSKKPTGKKAARKTAAKKPAAKTAKKATPKKSASKTTKRAASKKAGKKTARKSAVRKKAKK